MVTKNDDIKFLIAAADELKAYLLSDKLYRPSSVRLISTKNASNLITPGNILWAQNNLRVKLLAGQLTAADESAFAEVSAQIKTLLQEWRSAWENKVSADLQSRLRQWVEKLDELGKMGGDLNPYYSMAVRVRVFISLLSDELPGDTFPEAQLIAIQDQRLRKITGESEFVWEQALEQSFDREKYWYLYRLPLQSNIS